MGWLCSIANTIHENYVMDLGSIPDRVRDFSHYVEVSRASAARSKKSLLCGTDFSRIFLPELYPWRRSLGLATWKWKGEGVDLRVFLCGWLVLWALVNQLTWRWLRLQRGLASQGCLRVLLHHRNRIGVKYCRKSKGWFGLVLVFQIRSGRFVVSTYSASVRGDSVFHVNLCVQFLRVQCRLHELVKWTVWRGALPLPECKP